MGRYRSIGLDFPLKSWKLDENIGSIEDEDFYFGSYPTLNFGQPLKR